MVNMIDFCGLSNCWEKIGERIFALAKDRFKN